MIILVSKLIRVSPQSSLYPTPNFEQCQFHLESLPEVRRRMPNDTGTDMVQTCPWAISAN